MIVSQIFFFFLLELFFSNSFLIKKNFFRKTNIFQSMDINEDEELYKKMYYNYLLEYDLLPSEGDLKGSSVEIDDIFVERRENFELFRYNLNKIVDFNKQNHSFKLGYNQFMDSYNDTSNSFLENTDCNSEKDLMEKKITLYDVIKNDFISVKQLLENPLYYLEKYRNISDNLVWNSTIITSVKNQKRCGSCWAFSSTSAIEANMRINNYNVTRLSEQQLVDCSTENNGCRGGLMHLAFDYVIANNGLTSNENYPYNATDGICKSDQNNSCKSYKNIPGSNIGKYYFIVPRSVIDIMASLKKGPISIAIDASPFEFRFYKEGVIDVNPRNNSRLNHAVLLTGYEKYENGSYWIIQNSWGEKWGDNGFVKVKIENGNGILLSQMYGVYPFN